MQASRSYIPYDTSGDPFAGTGPIYITVYGQSEQEVRERFQKVVKESLLVGEPEIREDGNRWVVKWREQIESLADTIKFCRWNRNRKKR